MPLFLPRSLRASSILSLSALLTGIVVLNRPTVRLDAPKPLATDSSTPTPASPFPDSIARPSQPPLLLIATGIRTVSLFKIKVYEVGLYVDMSAPLPYDNEKGSAAERMRLLLEGRECMLRIAPTRQTSFTHMRDGFVRALNHRVSLLASPPSEATKAALSSLPSLFPKSSLSKGSILDIKYHPFPPPTTTSQKEVGWKLPLFGSGKSTSAVTSTDKTGDAYLEIEHEGRKLGEVQDGWVAREWFLAYFDEKREISQELRERVEEQLNLASTLKRAG